MAQKLTMLMNVMCFIIFIIHISTICYHSIYPDVPEIVVYKKDLSEIEFPLLFRICLFENENKNHRFHKYGYEGVRSFFSGLSMYNSSIVGWAGHTKNGSSRGSVSGKPIHRKL